MPLFLALSLSPILSIQVPQLKRFPPVTKPVAGSTLATTLNPVEGKKRRKLMFESSVDTEPSSLFKERQLMTHSPPALPSSLMFISILGPAFLSLKEIPSRWHCRASWITSYRGCSCKHAYYKCPHSCKHMCV